MSNYIIIVKSDNQIKIAQCGHRNGVPSGAGLKILDFLKSNSMTMLQRLLKDVTPYGEAYTKYARRNNTPEYTLGVEVLTEIIEGDRTQVVMDPMAKDDAFCEYVYIIDLDDKTFMVRKGANAEFHLYRLPTGVEFLAACGDEFY